MNPIQVIEDLSKSVLPIIAGILAVMGVKWVKGVFDQKKRNKVDEIDLSFKKINLDNQSKPLDDLVADSNKSHGINGPSVVKKPGNDS